MNFINNRRRICGKNCILVMYMLYHARNTFGVPKGWEEDSWIFLKGK
jgi:hypothetical protein